MGRIGLFYSRIGDFFRNLPFKTYIMIMLESIGLFANILAIITFYGATNTPKSSPNFYVSNQEFFTWSLVAGVYTLGLLGARFKRRWRHKLALAGIEEGENTFISEDPRSLLFRSDLHWHMFVRDFCFTLVVAFPLTFLYIRALDAAYTNGTASPWRSLGETILAVIPVTFMLLIASSIFDKALSLYAGD